MNLPTLYNFQQRGLRGPSGKSAYLLAVEDGFVGDEAAWLASLVGAPGLMSATTGPGVDAGTSNTEAITPLALANSTVIETRAEAAAATVADAAVDEFAQYAALETWVKGNVALRAAGMTTMATPAALTGLTIPGKGQRCEFPVFRYNPENSLFWGSGKMWASEATFFTGLGGVTSGGVTTFGPYEPSDAPELLLNNTFANTNDWAGSAGVALSVATDGGFPALVLTLTAATNGKASTRLNLAAGDTYRCVRFTAKVRRGTIAGTIKATAGSIISMNQVNGAINASTAYITSTLIVSGHEGDTNGANIYVGSLTTGTYSGTAYISSDGLSAKEVWPVINYPQGRSYQFIKFRTDATGTGEVSLASAGSETRSYWRLVYNCTTGALIFRVGGIGGGGGGDIALGTVAANTVGYVSFILAPDYVKAALNGAQPTGYAGNQVSIGGMSQMRILGDRDGNTSTGAILDWQIYAGACDDGWLTYASGEHLDPVVGIGDSYIERASTSDGLNFVKRLATSLGRPVANFATGGTTTHAQLLRFLDAPGIWDSTLVWWNGGGSGEGDALRSMEQFSKVRRALGHERFVILPINPPAPATAGTPGAGEEILRLRTEALTALLEDEYDGQWFTNSADRYVDSAPILVALSTGSANDLANLADGYRPESVYEVDKVHLTGTAHAACVAPVAAAITAVEA